MKKKLILFSILVFGLSLFANWVEIDSNRGQSLFSHDASTPSSIQLNFALDGYSLEQVNVNGTQFQKLTYQDESITIDEGLPSLPRFTRMIAVPETGNISVDVVYTDSTVLPDMMIYPSQSFSVERDEAGAFLMDESFYRQNTSYPENVVELSDPAVIRGYRVVSLVINPFQYNASTRELTISRNVEISINTDNTLTGRNEVALSGKKSRAFEKYMQSIVLNNEVVTTRDGEYQTPSLLFICPNSDTILENIDDLADWKHEIGYEVEVVSTSQTGTSLTTIKNYIQDAYDTWENPPEYVCIVGDANGSFAIPTGSYGGGAGDHIYTMLEGDDYLADIFIGRLSIESVFELQTIIGKIFNYERSPFMGTTDWYQNAVLIGDTSNSGQTTISTNKYIKEAILAENADYTFDEEYSGNFVNAITNGLNAGAAFLNYRGYIGMSGWGNTYTNALNNGFMLPIAMILTCGTGSFDSDWEESRSEAFLRAGSPGTPKGAVAAVGTATSATHTCFNNLVTQSTFYALFHKGLTNMGSALTYGKTQLWIDYPTNPNNHAINFSYWNNLMGDPTMNVWGGIPQLMNVDYNDEVAVGTNFQEITVTDVNGAPVEGAWVTILKGFDQIFASAYTDASGIAVLPIEGGSNGEAKVTVTKHEYYPHRGSFELGEMDVFVNVSEVTIDDNNSGDSSGNGNGQVNPGESIELALSMGNLGANTANNVTATISCDNEFVTVTDSEESYGNIDAGAESPGMDDFDIQVSPAILGSSEIKIDVVISDDAGNSWNDFVFLNVKGPSLYVESYDVVGGGSINPGAIETFHVTLENVGTVFAAGVSAELSLDNNMITIHDALGTFGDISPNGTANNSTDTFEIEVESWIIPGSQIVMDLLLTTPDGYNNSVQFILEIGEVEVTDPLGATDAQYIAYDNGDTNYIEAPIYDWVEIDPAYGGSGTSCGFNDGGNNGLLENVNLPFTMRYYGMAYDMISICSNGFVVPGGTENASYMNRTIPGPMSPSPMISPFWDDLMTGSGNVFYYYDAGQNRYIVQWSRIEDEYNGVEETFQLIIYNPNYYPNSNADSNLLFQYKVVNNVDVGDYDGRYYLHHGQYATVGLEDHTSDEGLQYTYNNTYPTAAKVLENEMAIFFTGPTGPHVEPFIVLGEVAYEDANGNGTIDYAEEIDLFVSLNNMGETAANEVEATLSIDDEYATVTQAVANYNTILGGSSAINTTPFEITISPNCPDQHVISGEINLIADCETQPLYVSLMVNAPSVQFQAMFVNDGDNNILDPGESADLLIMFENVGSSAAYYANLEVTTDDAYVTMGTTAFELGTILPDGVSTAILSLTVDVATPVAHVVNLDWSVNADYGLNIQGETNIVISQVPILIDESFETFPPEGWSVTGGSNWQHATTNTAGGVSPEVQFTWSPSVTGTQRLISMPFSTVGSSEIALNFKHEINDFNGDYTLMLQTSSDGETWNIAETFPSSNVNATDETVILTTDDVGSDDFRFAFVFEGNSYNINQWYIDDVVIDGIGAVNYGYITGDVTISGGAGDVRDVVITANEQQVSPNSDGDFVLALTPGSYDITASLSGYESVTQTNVTVTELGTTEVSFNISSLPNATNLIVEATDNDISLSWTAPEAEVAPLLTSSFNKVKKTELRSATSLSASFYSDVNKVRDTRDFTGYNIYRNNVLITSISDIAEVTYNDLNLNGGNYSYHITAVYDNGESLPTNSVEVVIVLAIPTGLAYTVETNANIILSWDASTYSGGADSYKVYRDDVFIDSTIEPTFSDEIEAGEYSYFITAIYGSYESNPSDVIEVNSVDAQESVVPLVTKLEGNYPNPFNPTTTISFALANPGHVKIKIYNIKGSLVKTLVDSDLEAANHKFKWNGVDKSGSTVASGMYFYKVKTEGYSETKKMLLLK